MDVKTLVLALALGNLSLCAALFFFEYEQKKSLTLSTWALAKQCQAAAWFLLYFRGLIPDLLSILLANFLLFIGMALDAGALWQAAGHGHWRRVLVPALLLAMAAFLACYLVDVAAPLRVAAGALIVSGFFAAGVGALVRSWRRGRAGPPSMLHRYLAVVMGALTLVLAGRAVLAATLPLGWSWITPGLLQVISFCALYLMMLTNAFGYLLLSREQLQRELARLEVVDAATDVPNRRGFYQMLAPWMALARRPGLATSLIVLNLDHFKRVNDSYGHQVGDMLLKSVVEVCRKQLRDSDLMGRLGGAEFAIQLPRTALADAMLVAERVRAAIAAVPFKTERAMIGVTASLGVTTIRAEDSTVSLLKRADEALQAAKQAGRNCVVEASAASVLDA